MAHNLRSRETLACSLKLPRLPYPQCLPWARPRGLVLIPLQLVGQPFKNYVAHNAPR